MLPATLDNNLKIVIFIERKNER